MVAEVYLKYNPYIPQLSVLLDGKPPSEYSRIIQYTNEDIIEWSKTLLDVIYDEIRCDFVVIFTGTESDAEIIKYRSKNTPHCKQYIFRQNNFKVSTQKKMMELNQYLKKNDVKYPNLLLQLYFKIPSNMWKIRESISCIDVNNLFCTTEISILQEREDRFEENENTYLFVLTENYEECKEKSKKIATSNPSFLFYFGQKNRLKKIYHMSYIIECEEEYFIPAVFSCLLWEPLVHIFRSCMQSVWQKQCDEQIMSKMISIDPIISVQINNQVEVGRSSVIRKQCIPSDVTEPQIYCKVLNEEIATTDNINVYGIKSGTTKLEVYQYGAVIPFQILDICVVERNRITKIILREDELVIGIGDTKFLQADYFPVDADNMMDVVWKSSDSQIAEIDKQGIVTGIREGKCKLICSAENVSAMCECYVLPYVNRLIVNGVSNNCIHMEPMQEMILHISTYPEKCIDGEYTIISSDYNIVNVIGNKLLAKQIGDAQIIVMNQSGRQQITIEVHVYKTRIFNSIMKKYFKRKEV